MKQVVSWGLFVEHQKGSSCHKPRKASVVCWFYQQVYHLALSTQIYNQLPKKQNQMGKNNDGMWLMCSGKYLSEDILSSRTVEYIAIWIITKKTKQPHSTVSLPLPLGIVICFLKKENRTVSLPSLPYSVTRDPNSWKEKPGNVLANQWFPDFDETKWAHHKMPTVHIYPPQ